MPPTYPNFLLFFVKTAKGMNKSSLHSYGSIQQLKLSKLTNPLMPFSSISLQNLDYTDLQYLHPIFLNRDMVYGSSQRDKVTNRKQMYFLKNTFIIIFIYLKEKLVERWQQYEFYDNIQSYHTKLRMVLTLFACCWSCWNTSSIHEPFVSCNPLQNTFRLKSQVPNFLCNRTCSNPQLSVQGILVIELSPQQHFNSQDILLMFVFFQSLTQIFIIKILIGCIFSIHIPIDATYSSIQTIRFIVRNNNFVIYLRQIPTNPFHNIIAFVHVLIFTIEPKQGFFIWVQSLNQFLLLFPILNLQVIFFDFLQLQKLCQVRFTLKAYLITSQVNVWVRKNVNDLCENLLNQFICFIQSNIERTNISIIIQGT